jgi:pimeloyl-ACP methyl ester carboxylesterase
MGLSSLFRNVPLFTSLEVSLFFALLLCWPLCSDAWDSQMLFLAQNGFRVVAHDRRGHGRSSQAWSGNDMNGYADDLAALIEALDLTDVTMVGHSTGGGEVARLCLAKTKSAFEINNIKKGM